MKWNTGNLWRASFAVTFIGIFLGICQWKQLGEFIGIIGGIMLICMACARFEDVREFLDRNSD